jgi:hypothetical protein
LRLIELLLVGFKDLDGTGRYVASDFRSDYCSHGLVSLLGIQSKPLDGEIGTYRLCCSFTRHQSLSESQKGPGSSWPDALGFESKTCLGMRSLRLILSG